VRRVRSFLASRIEFSTEPLIRLLELSFSLFRTTRRLEFPIRLEQHSLARGFERVPIQLELMETVGGWAEFPLEPSNIRERIGQGLNGLYKASEPLKYRQRP
jgi:hypothetical protein